MFFKNKKRKKAFDEKLAFLKNNNQLVKEFEDSQTFIYINKTIQEFVEDQACKILLFSCEASSNVVKSDLFFEEATVFIEDLKVNDLYQNKGYGTEVLKSIISISKNIDAVKISGNLSTVDFDHKDQLEVFYKKQGFSIIELENDTLNFGRIELQLRH